MIRRWLWLVDKKCRELISSRAWWVMLLAMGPLVGVSFISAVRTYAEASGLNGTAIGVGEAFSPLIGVWAPTSARASAAEPPGRLDRCGEGVRRRVRGARGWGYRMADHREA